MPAQSSSSTGSAGATDSSLPKLLLAEIATAANARIQQSQQQIQQLSQAVNLSQQNEAKWQNVAHTATHEALQQHELANRANQQAERLRVSHQDALSGLDVATKIAMLEKRRTCEAETEAQETKSQMASEQAQMDFQHREEAEDY